MNDFENKARCSCLLQDNIHGKKKWLKLKASSENLKTSSQKKLYTVDNSTGGVYITIMTTISNLDSIYYRTSYLYSPLKTPFIEIFEN